MSFKRQTLLIFLSNERKQWEKMGPGEMNYGRFMCHFLHGSYQLILR